MNSKHKNIEDLDLYGLLEIEISATESDIKKAYRKKALQCHPDKNPDNPKAAETFHELSRALEILTDTAARAAYDRVIKAKEAAKLRNRELDSKRLKLKEDLERREREAENKRSSDNRTDAEKLAAEIERLRKEGSKLLQEEQKRMQDQIAKELSKEPVWDSSLNRIKIKWNSTKDDPSNGGYSEDILRRCFKKYGEIVVLLLSPNKKGSALIEFATKEAAEMAIEIEKGLQENPLTLKWLNERPILKTATTGPTLVSERDYESVVLAKLRHAAERQKLIEQMMKEEEEANKP